MLIALAGLFSLCTVCTASVLLMNAFGLTSASTPTRPADLLPGRAAQAPAGTPSPAATNTPKPTATLAPSDTASATATPASTNSPTALLLTPTPDTAIPAATGSECVPQDTRRTIAQVSKVVDGDTIDVTIDGQTYPVRYIGIDAPETSFQQEPFGKESSERNAALVVGKTVLLVKDKSETDRFDRLLRYVFVGDAFVNYELVRQGYATSIEYPPDTACAQAFQGAQELAQTEGLGRWAAPVASTNIPTPGPTSVPPYSGEATLPPQVEGDCSPAYPTVCISPPPPDLDCADITARRFQVLPPDPHNFDGDHNGIGCERD